MIQEALENILVYPLKDDCINSPCGECQDPCDFYKMKERDYEILKALVDRATPMKPIKYHYEEEGEQPYIKCNCPSCCVERQLHGYMEFCPYCGQALDWEDPQNAKM